MSERLRLDRFDDEFSARTTRQDWQRITHVRNHPRFLDGVIRYDELVPAVFADNIILSRAGTEITRIQMIAFVLHLHDTAGVDVPKTGLTLTRLQRLCSTHGLASPGGVLAFVGIMMLAGYLQRQRSARDRRVVHLVPTEKFIRIVESWTRGILLSIDVIEPEGALAQLHAAHPRFGWDMREHSAQVVLEGWKPLDPFPEVAHFLDGQGGWMLLYRCVADVLRIGQRRKIVPIALDLAKFGKTYGASRSQLRLLLDSAHRAGLLDAPPGNGQHILVSEKLLTACLTVQASELANYRLCALATKSALGLA
jgi:hypothetical protein